MFQLHSRVAEGAAAQAASVPHYYAYAAPPTPTVAGANTQQQDQISVINEDGTIAPVGDIGQVLGVSTDDVQQSLDTIKIKQVVPNSPEAIRGYLHYTENLVVKYLDGAALENALSANNPQQVQTTVGKVRQLISAFEQMYVPQDAVTLHKLTLAQYYAAEQLLKNFPQLDSNPDLAAKNLGVFMQAQQQQNQELQQLLTKYGMADSLAIDNTSNNNGQ